MSATKGMGLGEAKRWNSGVVSLLDDEHNALVEDIWSELEQEFGVNGVRRTPWPHVSYQLGDYDLRALPEILERVAAATPPFGIETMGLGIFTGLEPIVYVPVVRTGELSEWHRLLWTAIGTACRNAADHYWLSEWIPHITLAMGDVDAANLPRIINFLSARNFAWQVDIDNLAFIDASYEGQELAVHLKLAG
jgi:hypothetical protein